MICIYPNLRSKWQYAHLFPTRNHSNKKQSPPGIGCLSTMPSVTRLPSLSTSGSLPPDYRLARYSEDEGNNQNTTGYPNEALVADDNTNCPTRGVSNRRRNSFTVASYQRSAAYVHDEPLWRSRSPTSFSEREPLLGRIPRIEEEGNQPPNAVHGSEIATWRNEVGFSCIPYHLHLIAK